MRFFPLDDGDLSVTTVFPSSPAANNPPTLMATSPRPTEDVVARSPRRQQYLIRSDVHYDLGSKTLTAMLELPGVKKSEVRVTLSTCYYNRVKQVTVYGRTRPVFPVSGFPEGIDGPPDLTVRERKFGDFSRTFAVPSETKVRFPLFPPTSRTPCAYFPSPPFSLSLSFFYCEFF